MTFLAALLVCVPSAVMCGLIYEQGIIDAPVVFFWGACTSLVAISAMDAVDREQKP